ncbi:unnamed protein product [Callosobruchus maculatus]|uniref:tRNA (uracil(54)-C(5))-methyltransferase n=1 Tax=Callosobruchus maculatus TaxID=64391 RepID=A0A653DLW1_CALMS|nr:unnamed protein product [Callosobruchus maculatus]
MTEVDQLEQLPKETPVDENSEKIAENETEDSPFAYLQRDFSSESFKIEIKNLPRFYGYHELRKLLNEKLKLNANKIKAIRRNSPFVFVCFRNDEDRENAISVLTKYHWKGKELNVLKAKPSPDPLVKKRKEDADDSPASKKMKEDDNRSQEEKLKDSVIPYWNTDYDEQLKLKQEGVKKVLSRLASQLAYYNPQLQQWIEKQKESYNGLPCELLDLRGTVQSQGYRNKCEFTVGIDEETKLKTVGFRIGSYMTGTTGVAPVDNLIHIPEAMKVVVKAFQTYVRSSDLLVYNPETHTGHFKQLAVRLAPEQLMISVGINPQDLSEEDLKKLKDSLVQFFTEGEGKHAKVTSLYYQKTVRKTRNDDFVPAEHLWGEKYIYETVLGLKFRISPEAFFQINTKGAEVLYQSAMEFAEPLQDAVVLDVCCGTGTIGLCFAKHCKKVLGIESVSQAIVDAKENATSNNITNAEFFEGKAESILGNVAFQVNAEENVVAVVDPPRPGLQKKAVFKLRNIPKIKKVVYMSCNPYLVLQNFIDLGRPTSKKVHGDPLVPTKAVAVDMFPFTRHCELVVCFERWEDVKARFTEVKIEANQMEVDAVPSQQTENNGDAPPAVE